MFSCLLFFQAVSSHTPYDLAEIPVQQTIGHGLPRGGWQLLKKNSTQAGLNVCPLAAPILLPVGHRQSSTLAGERQQKSCLFVPRSSLLSLIQLSLRNQPPVQSRSSFPLLSAGTNRGPWSLFILSVKQLQISHFSMSSALHILCFSTFTSSVRMNLN